jgi:hypothetical protein
MIGKRGKTEARTSLILTRRRKRWKRGELKDDDTASPGMPL